MNRRATLEQSGLVAVDKRPCRVRGCTDPADHMLVFDCERAGHSFEVLTFLCPAHGAEITPLCLHREAGGEQK